MNSLIAFIYVLKNYPEYMICLQRLTNFLVVKTFGNTREYVNNSIDQELFKRILFHETLRKEWMHGFKKLYIKFNEQGGIITNPSFAETFDFDKSIFEEEIYFEKKCNCLWICYRTERFS